MIHPVYMSGAASDHYVRLISRVVYVVGSLTTRYYPTLCGCYPTWCGCLVVVKHLSIDLLRDHDVVHA